MAGRVPGVVLPHDSVGPRGGLGGTSLGSPPKPESTKSVAANILLEPGFFATYAVAQAVILLLLVRLVEPFESPPVATLALMAIWGATGAALLALAGDEAIGAAVPGHLRAVLGDVIAPPLVEEPAKGVVLLFAALTGGAVGRRGGWRFEGVGVGLACGAAVGIGFGFTEDFFYFVNHAGETGVRSGADIYLGRRDFFGPTALHHPAFTAVLGAGLGAAVAARTARRRILWPLAGLATAILMHAVNNGLLELLLVLEHGIDAASTWAEGRPVPAGVESSADAAELVLATVNYLILAMLAGSALVWQRGVRAEVEAALAVDVDAGLVDREDVLALCRFGGRTRIYARLLAAGDLHGVRRAHAHHRALAKLGAARRRERQDGAGAAEVSELRRGLIATAGVVRRPGTVDAPGGELIGRERDLAALDELLGRREVRQVTIAGPGGVGKTRLALELAARLGPRYAHGAYFVDLSRCTDSDQVGPAIAAALEIELPAAEDPAAWLGRLLRDRELLLVVDNFEHVADAATLTSELAVAAARLRLLATSRAPLGGRDETVYRLEPLDLNADSGDLSAAAMLFLACARRHGEVIDGRRESALVEKICARLDGLPLAIELVAARTPTLPPAALAARLDRVLDLAAAGGTGMPPRQRTLRAAIAWSEELLEPQARRLLSSLSLFPAGCRLDALEAAAGPALLEPLEALIRGSLVTKGIDPDGGARFRLAATVRDYAIERCDPREPPEVTLAAYDFSLTELLVFEPPWPEPVAATLEVERPNLMAGIQALESTDPELALELAVRLGPLWERSDLRGTTMLLEPLLEKVPATPRLAAGEALAGRLDLLQGRYREARRRLRSSLDADVDARLRFSCRSDLGWATMFTGELEEAERVFAVAAREARESLGEREEARALGALARARAERGDPEAAVQPAGRSLALYERLGDARGATGARSTLARIALLDGGFELATERAMTALGEARRHGDRLREAEALFPLATAQLLIGRPNAATRAGRERLEACRDLGDRLGVAETLDLSALLLGTGDEATHALAAADSLRREIGARRWPWDQALLESRLGARLPPADPEPAASGGFAAALALAEAAMEDRRGPGRLFPRPTSHTETDDEHGEDR